MLDEQTDNQNSTEDQINTSDIKEKTPISSDEKENDKSERITRESLKTFLTWKSFIRPFRPIEKNDKEIYKTIGSILFLACVIFLFLHEYLLIVVLIAFAFFTYLYRTVQPEEVEHAITNQGIMSIGKTYYWDQLGRFWFEQKNGVEILYIENYGGLPTRLMILISSEIKEQVDTLIGKYLLMEKPEKTQIEKWSDWLQAKFPMDSQPSSNNQNIPKSSKK